MKTCEYGYPEPCGKPAVYRGMMPKYPDFLYACEEHKLPMFGILAHDQNGTLPPHPSRYFGHYCKCTEVTR